jgi:hypothetical protein
MTRLRDGSARERGGDGAMRGRRFCNFIASSKVLRQEYL